MDLFQKLVEFLPRLKTKIQLTGFIVTVSGFLAVKAIAPDQLLAQIMAGAVGVLFIVFGQSFHFLHLIRESDRPKYILALFFGFLVFVLAFLVITILLASPGQSSADIKLSDVANSLREEYKRVLDAHQPPFTKSEFDRVQELLIGIRQLDQDNGHLHYYQGEIKRKLSRKIDSHDDFFRYLEVEQTLPPAERDESLDAEVCYRRTRGYCRQRTAWICHLLANDFFDAAKQTDNIELKRNYLENALSYADCVFKKYPSGFSDPGQLTPTFVLQKEIEKLFVN